MLLKVPAAWPISRRRAPQLAVSREREPAGEDASSEGNTETAAAVAAVKERKGVYRDRHRAVSSPERREKKKEEKPSPHELN